VCSLLAPLIIPSYTTSHFVNTISYQNILPTHLLESLLITSSHSHNNLPLRPSRLQLPVCIWSILKLKHLINHRLQLPLLHPLPKLRKILKNRLRHTECKRALATSKRRRYQESTCEIEHGAKSGRGADLDVFGAWFGEVGRFPVERGVVADVVEDEIKWCLGFGESFDDVGGAIVDYVICADFFA
jgi:hypothetical protein